MPITFSRNDYKDLMQKPEIMDRIVRVNQGDTVTFEKGVYRGVHINVVSNLSDFRKNLKKVKGVVLHGVGIHLIGQKDNGDEGAILTDLSTISIFSPNVTVEGFTFKEGGYIDANIRKKFPTLWPTGAKILNNDFIGGRGYAKRIKVGSTSEHEAFKMNILIQENQFVNIKGQNNRGKSGGEIISVKTSRVQVVRNQFKNCVGRLSLRGGVKNVAKDNSFSGRSKKCGIQVYGNASQVLNNTLDNKMTILIGAGESNFKAGQQPFGDHLPAHRADIQGNRGGRVTINAQYCRVSRNRRRPQYQHTVGRTRIFCYKVKDVTVQDVVANNQFRSVKDKARGGPCRQCTKKDQNGRTYQERMALHQP